MPISSVNDNAGKDVLIVQVRRCFCNRRATLKISGTEKNPNRVYAKCETNTCSYFRWVKAEHVGDEEFGNTEILSSADSMDTAVLYNRISRLERDVEAMKMESVQNRIVLAAVLIILFFVMFGKG